MSLSIPWLTQTFISSHASANSFSRSKSLGGSVRNIIRTSDGFRASVSGTSEYYVSISVLSTNSLQCDCSCPDNRGGYCKHTCAVLTQLLNGNPGTSSPTTYGTQSSPKQKSYSYQSNSSNTTSSASGKALFEELSQLATKYDSSKDGSLLAKIACLIYKNSKEAVAGVKYNPNGSLDVMFQIVCFCIENNLLFRQKLAQLTGAVEMTAKACSKILPFVVDNNKISQFHSRISANKHITWGNVSANYCWKDAQDIVQRKTKLQTMPDYNYLLS